MSTKSRPKAPDIQPGDVLVTNAGTRAAPKPGDFAYMVKRSPAWSNALGKYTCKVELLGTGAAPFKTAHVPGQWFVYRRVQP